MDSTREKKSDKQSERKSDGSQQHTGVGYEELIETEVIKEAYADPLVKMLGARQKRRNDAKM